MSRPHLRGASPTQRSDSYVRKVARGRGVYLLCPVIHRPLHRLHAEPPLPGQGYYGGRDLLPCVLQPVGREFGACIAQLQPNEDHEVNGADRFSRLLKERLLLAKYKLCWCLSSRWCSLPQSEGGCQEHNRSS